MPVWYRIDQLNGASITFRLFSFRYRYNALRFSELLHDQSAAPIDSAAWLLEHTIRTGGAEHLKLASRNLNIWQYLGLDVALFILVALGLVGTVTFKATVWCFARRGDGMTRTKLKMS